MANFEPAYNLVADAEGGYQDNPNDRGNYNSLGKLIGTNWGISAGTLESWLGYPPDRQDMVNLTRSTAKEIYRARFWDDIRGNQIKSQPLANIFFDGRVNHGRTGVKLMQRVLRVPDDGVVGPITLNALNSRDPGMIYNAYKKIRRAFYNQLVNNNSSQSVFLQGWLNRLNKFDDFPKAVGAAAVAIILLIILLTVDLESIGL